ncbi:MAG: hypothetical protein NT138_02595 [Planctomycetales bacterium]|nr:hypothetical protein [Planctomycetales bacterium]
MAATRDPTPEQIAAACLEIQSGWSDRERLSRLRSDQRPTHRLADGRREAMSSSVYNGHHERG